MLRLLFTASVVAFVAQAYVFGHAAASTETLRGKTIEEWRERLLPPAVDRRWETIPWRPGFADGLLAANQEQRPLLLWLMNGHPLGCT